MVKGKNSKKSAYKHRETFLFKGFTYRYDKIYGLWRRVERKGPNNLPDLVFSVQGKGQWRAGSVPDAPTPIAALERWLSSLIALRTQEATEAARRARDLREVVRQLRAREWV